MNNLAVIPPDVEVQLRTTSRELVSLAGDVIIMTRADLSLATDLVKTIKTRAKEIEEERVRLVKPIKDSVKEIDARFKALIVPLEEAEADVKAKMLAFQKAEDARIAEETRRAEEARRVAEEKARKEAEESSNGDDIRSMPIPEVPKIEPVIPQHRPTTYGQTGAVSTVKKVWAFDLVDIKALANARPDLIMVDTTRVNQEIRGKGGDISGLRVYEKEIMQVR
jgi:hypothetical protein